MACWKAGSGLFCALSQGFLVAGYCDEVRSGSDLDFLSTKEVPDFLERKFLPEWDRWSGDAGLGIKVPPEISRAISEREKQRQEEEAKRKAAEEEEAKRKAAEEEEARRKAAEEAARPKSYAERVKSKTSNDRPPVLFSQIPLVERYTVLGLGSFYNQAVKQTLSSQGTFTTFNSLNEWSLWGDVFGDYNNFYVKDMSELKNKTLGIKVCGGKTYGSSFTLGIGTGAAFSRVKWKISDEKFSEAKAQTLFFGPYIGYQLENGYIAAQIAGVRSVYTVERYQSDKGGIAKLDSKRVFWDFALQCEGGLDFLLPFGKLTYLRPSLCLSYISTFQNEYTEEENEDKLYMVNPKGIVGYVDSKVYLELRKEFFRPHGLLIAPKVRAGVSGGLPTAKETRYGITGFQDNQSWETLEKEKGSANLLLGAELSVLHPKAFGFSIKYEARLLGNHQMQIGSLGFDWDW